MENNLMIGVIFVLLALIFGKNALVILNTTPQVEKKPD